MTQWGSFPRNCYLKLELPGDTQAGVAQTKGLPGVSLAFLAVAPLCLGSELPEAEGCSGGESCYGGPWAPCTVLAQSPRSLGPPWPCQGVLGAGLG